MPQINYTHEWHIALAAAMTELDIDAIDQLKAWVEDTLMTEDERIGMRVLANAAEEMVLNNRDF